MCTDLSLRHSFDTKYFWSREITGNHWCSDGKCICGKYFNAAVVRMDCRKYFNQIIPSVLDYDFNAYGCDVQKNAFEAKQTVI